MTQEKIDETGSSKDILETLRFEEIPLEQLLHIRLMHTNFLLKESNMELGIAKKMLKEAQNALKEIKRINIELREEIKSLKGE